MRRSTLKFTSAVFIKLTWKLRCLATAFFFVSIFVSWTAHTAIADDVARAEAWFNKKKTIKADFIQIASDGTSFEGKLLFSRPSRMRIIYGDGTRLQLLTSKIWLHVDRPDEKLLSSYPISETPLSLILATKVSLRPEGYETTIKRSSVGVVQIIISKDKGEGAGKLTLEFSEKPFQFRRWIIVDAAGIETSVTIQNPSFDKLIPNDIYRVPDYSDND